MSRYSTALPWQAAYGSVVIILYRVHAKQSNDCVGLYQGTMRRCKVKQMRVCDTRALTGA